MAMAMAIEWLKTDENHMEDTFNGVGKHKNLQMSDPSDKTDTAVFCVQTKGQCQKSHMILISSPDTGWECLMCYYYRV